MFGHLSRLFGRGGLPPRCTSQTAAIAAAFKGKNMKNKDGCTLDYAANMQDHDGRTVKLFINGDSIDCMVKDGYEYHDAREGVEGNSFQNAIASGEIGADAWLTGYEGLE